MCLIWSIIHLIVHQAIYISDLEHHLLCPMQCRANKIETNDYPRMYCENPSEEFHAVVTCDNDGVKVVISFF